MFDRFSREAHQALVVLYRCATPGAVLADIDLLDALGRCQDGAARQVLTRVDPARADPADVPIPGETDAPPPHLGLELRGTFHRAEILRRRSGQPLVTTGHLLLALVDARPPASGADSVWVRLARVIDRAELIEQEETPAAGERRIVSVHAASIVSGHAAEAARRTGPSSL